jgi:hypothetical protein
MTPRDPDDVGTKLLFENERVRVWSVEVPPGEAFGPHEHRTAYLTVVASPSDIASVMDDGHVELEAEAEVDRVDWYPGGEPRVHTLENRGSGFYKNFTVELLDAPRSPGEA